MIVSDLSEFGNKSAYRLACSKGVTMTPWRSSCRSKSTPSDFCSITILASVSKTPV